MRDSEMNISTVKQRRDVVVAVKATNKSTIESTVEATIETTIEATNEDENKTLFLYRKLLGSKAYWSTREKLADILTKILIKCGTRGGELRPLILRTLANITTRGSVQTFLKQVLFIPQITRSLLFIVHVINQAM
jgi:NTP pyrophosphatase (non-canonical NTP hydrolase)